MTPQPDHLPGGTGTVLFVDDDRMIREFGAALLEHIGYEAVTAADAEEGLRLFDARPDGFRLVVLDVLLPGLPGRAMYDRVRESRPCLPFVIMSGLDFSAAEERFGTIDPEFYLVKPFSIGTLSRAVERALACGGEQ